MKPALDIRPVGLAVRAVHRIERGAGLRIAVVGGSVRVTQARDPRDVTLAQGRSFILDRKGRAVVYTLRDAAIVFGPAGHTAADFTPDTPA